MQSRWFLALNRPRVVSVLLSEVHLQQALILAATGCADKRHNGRGCGVNHPSARLQQSCAYCRMPALLSLLPQVILGQNSILPSCNTIFPQCCGCSPHSVLACATEEVSYTWILVPGSWYLGLKTGITGPGSSSQLRNLSLYSWVLLCPLVEEKGHPGLDVHLLLSNWCTADEKWPWRASFCPLMRKGANHVTCIDSGIWAEARPRDGGRNQEKEAFLKCAVLMNIFKSKQRSPGVRQSTKIPDFKSQKGGDTWLSVCRMHKI